MTKQELMETCTVEEIANMVVAFEEQLSEVKNGKYSVIFGTSIEKGNITKLKILENGKVRIKEVPTVEMFSGNSDENERIYCKGLYLSKELYPKIGVIVKYPDCGKSNKIELDEKSECLIRNKLTDRIHEIESEVEKYRKALEGAKKDRDCQIAEYQKKIEDLEHDLKTAGEKIQDLAGENMKLQCERNDYKSKSEFLEVERMRVNKNKFIDFLPTEPIKVASMMINAEGEYEHNPIEKALCGEDKGIYRIFNVSELRQIAEHLLVYCNHNGEVEE